jgi:hypothetical protein
VLKFLIETLVVVIIGVILSSTLDYAGHGTS